ncbi:MAG TPA: hypothetical protein VGS19_18380 [Streptosporangiaceae bacterium]|nr:hypothetical protein [Streptosporangiaceae bacterium]
MTSQPYVVTLEGPCCAGKTTLGRRLLQELDGLKAAFAPCYADYAGGRRFLPRQEARSVREREQALLQLLDLEAGRLADLPSDSDAIIADRSVHTLLAHSYALEQMTGIRLFAPSVRLLHESLIPAWPDLVVYLDLPQDAVGERNHGKFPAGSIYTDPAFNTSVRAYFSRLAGQKTPHVMWLDATLDPAELARLTGLRVRQMAGFHDIEGAV